MMWNSGISVISRSCSVISLALPAALLICANVTFAQTPEDYGIPSLNMAGREAIDSKENVSGNAVVGVSFFNPDDSFNPDAIYVYFEKPVDSSLRTQLTTVDGRYIGSFEPPNNSEPAEGWRILTLTVTEGSEPRTMKEDSEAVPVNRRFLAAYDVSEALAMLVSDTDNRIYPLRWGSPCALNSIRIRVNAEGADAYYVKYDKDAKKQKLEPCKPVSSGSSFKFDHNCDVSLLDISKMDVFQVIRKRGATYEKPIPIKIEVPDTLAEIQSHPNCPIAPKLL
jgi:hypothetical protein